jgi:hypothetical protein
MGTNDMLANKSANKRGRRPAMAAAAALSFLCLAQTGSAQSSLIDSLIAALSAQAAEGLAGLEQRLQSIDPLILGTAAPFLSDLIISSRDEALAYGVHRIPPTVRAELEGYVPTAVLDLARWCVDCGGMLSLQQNIFRLGYSPAVTLDYVVVFKSREDALRDPSLWAHELKHVMQFMRWGVSGFAAKYVEDYEAVEREAAEFRWEWMKRTDYLERRKLSSGGSSG